jgi:hypothetical protein
MLGGVKILSPIHPPPFFCVCPVFKKISVLGSSWDLNLCVTDVLERAKHHIRDDRTGQKED